MERKKGGKTALQHIQDWMHRFVHHVAYHERSGSLSSVTIHHFHRVSVPTSPQSHMSKTSKNTNIIFLGEGGEHLRHNVLHTKFKNKPKMHIDIWKRTWNNMNQRGFRYILTKLIHIIPWIAPRPAREWLNQGCALPSGRFHLRLRFARAYCK